MVRTHLIRNGVVIFVASEEDSGSSIRSRRKMISLRDGACGKTLSNLYLSNSKALEAT